MWYGVHANEGAPNSFESWGSFEQTSPEVCSIAG